MKNKLWIVISVVAIIAIYFIVLEIVGDRWYAGEISSGFGAASVFIYLLFNIRKPFPKKVSISLVFLSLLLMFLGLAAWVYNDFVGNYKQLALMYERKSLSKNILRESTYNPLLKTFYEFKSKREKDFDLDVCFSENFTKNKELQKQLNENKDNDRIKITVYKADKDTIILIGQDNNLDGSNPEFINYDKTIGKVQVRAVLTKTGVVCEYQN